MPLISMRVGSFDLVADPILRHWNDYDLSLDPAPPPPPASEDPGSGDLGTTLLETSSLYSSLRTSGGSTVSAKPETPAGKFPWLASALIQVEISPSQLVFPVDHLHKSRESPGEVEDSALLTSSHFFLDSRSGITDSWPESLIIHLPSLHALPQQPIRPLPFEDLEFPVTHEVLSKENPSALPKFIPLDVHFSSLNVETITATTAPYSLKQDRTL